MFMLEVPKQMQYSKVLGLVALTVIVASIGLATAMWTDTLKINATIKTGKVDVKWSAVSCSDTGADPQAPGFHNDEGKNVASCNVSIVGEGNDTLRIVLSNVYPGYQVVVTGVVDNIGTIPVKLNSYSINGTATTEFSTSALTASLNIPSDTQIEPGKNSTYTLTITIKEAAHQGATYVIDAQLTFANWNEVSGS